MTKHREYPIALKQAAVARVAAGESVAEVAHDLKLRGRLLYAWRDKVRTGGPAGLSERGRPRKGAAPAVAAAGEGELARGSGGSPSWSARPPPPPVGAGRITVSFRPAIPRRVAPQQSPLPLRRPGQCTTGRHPGRIDAGPPVL